MSEGSKDDVHYAPKCCVDGCRLDPKTTKERAKELLRQNLNGQLQFHRVSRDVNSSRFAGKLEPLNPL